MKKVSYILCVLLIAFGCNPTGNSQGDSGKADSLDSGIQDHNTFDASSSEDATCPIFTNDCMLIEQVMFPYVLEIRNEHDQCGSVNDCKIIFPEFNCNQIGVRWCSLAIASSKENNFNISMRDLESRYCKCFNVDAGPGCFSIPSCVDSGIQCLSNECL